MYDGNANEVAYTITIFLLIKGEISDMKKMVFLFLISIIFFLRSAMAFNMPELDELYEQYKQCKIDDAIVEREIDELMHAITGYESVIDEWKSVLADDSADSDLVKDAYLEIDKHIAFINDAKSEIQNKLKPFHKKADDWMKKVAKQEPEIPEKYNKECPDGPPIKEIVKIKSKDTPEQPPGDDKSKADEPETDKSQTEELKTVKSEPDRTKIDKKETDYSDVFLVAPDDDGKAPYQVEERFDDKQYEYECKTPSSSNGDPAPYKGLDDALGDLDNICGSK